MSPETLHRRCCGKARGWLRCVHRWAPDGGGFPRRGWWAETAGGLVYLGRTTDDVLRRHGGAPPLTTTETP